MNILLEVYRDHMVDPVDYFTQPPFLPSPPLWRVQKTKKYISNSSPIRCAKTWKAGRRWWPFSCLLFPFLLADKKAETWMISASVFQCLISSFLSSESSYLLQCLLDSTPWLGFSYMDMIMDLFIQWQPQRWASLVLFWESFLEAHLRIWKLLTPCIKSLPARNT